MNINKLSKARRKIDSIDAKIFNLIKERFESDTQILIIIRKPNELNATFSKFIAAMKSIC